MKSENSFLFTRLDAFKPNLLIQSDSCGLSWFLHTDKFGFMISQPNYTHPSLNLNWFGPAFEMRPSRIAHLKVLGVNKSSGGMGLRKQYGSFILLVFCPIKSRVTWILLATRKRPASAVIINIKFFSWNFARKAILIVEIYGSYENLKFMVDD